MNLSHLFTLQSKYAQIVDKDKLLKRGGKFLIQACSYVHMHVHGIENPQLDDFWVNKM